MWYCLGCKISKTSSPNCVGCKRRMDCTKGFPPAQRAWYVLRLGPLNPVRGEDPPPNPLEIRQLYSSCPVPALNRRWTRGQGRWCGEKGRQSCVLVSSRQASGERLICRAPPSRVQTGVSVLRNCVSARLYAQFLVCNLPVQARSTWLGSQD